MDRKHLNKIIEYINNQPITNGTSCNVTCYQTIFPSGICISLYSDSMNISKINLNNSSCTNRYTVPVLSYKNLTTLEYELLNEAIQNYIHKCITQGGKTLMVELGLT